MVGKWHIDVTCSYPHTQALQSHSIPIIILNTHLHKRKEPSCDVVEQQFNSSVYLPFHHQHSQLKPLILPWGSERMKVPCGEPEWVERWCLYAVLVAVVLKHRTQCTYCAVQSQINEERQARATPSCRMGLLKKVWKIQLLGKFQLC